MPRSVQSEDESLSSDSSGFEFDENDLPADMENDKVEFLESLNSDGFKHHCIRKMMKNLEIEPKHTSASGGKNISEIVEIASLVRLYGENYSSFCESFEKELCKRNQLDREITLRKKQIDIINKKLNTIHKKFELLKNHVPSESTKGQTQTETTEKRNHFEYLASKCNKYSTQIAHLRRRLDINTKTPSHPKLSERAEHLTQVRKQISAMKNELDAYIEFPADINLAKVKLEEAKRQLELLDQNLSFKIDLSKS
ncbi:HAUS augmin-like complex subunit 1 [Convolutriloba macropyga]|uniref:HAUS augmin-like complex subunit 1 n=1 Tax=Convolutriloba macropyga TaxID=536237 RepID=UPI003F51E4FE